MGGGQHGDFICLYYGATPYPYCPCLPPPPSPTFLYLPLSIYFILTGGGRKEGGEVRRHEALGGRGGRQCGGMEERGKGEARKAHDVMTVVMVCVCV